MTSPNEKILKQKEDLAAAALIVAEESLDLLKQNLEECSARDLITIFNSAVKAHRDIVSDIISISESESKQEQALAKAYDSTLDNLLKKITK